MAGPDRDGSSSRAEPKLQRSLGLPSLSFYGIGLILGAGVYSVIGAAAAEAGAALWLSFAIGGAAALLTGLSYAELATTFPRAAAEFVYLGKAIPESRWPAAVVGLVLAIAAAATAATVALAFAGYLATFVDVPHALTAAAVLIVFTAVNAIGLR